MPARISSKCALPTCGELALAGGSRCANHTREMERSRGSAHARGYTRRWYRATRMWIRQDWRRNFCSDPFGVHGARLEPATQTDHIIPHRGDPVLFWTESNWSRLCGPCHSKKTAGGQ